MKLDQIKNSWTEVVRNRSLHSNSDPYVETGDAPADAAVFAMVVLLVNLQNNIIPSTTNQMISRNNLPMVASEKKISHRRRRTCTSCRSTRPCKLRSCSTPAQPEKQKGKNKKKIWISWIHRKKILGLRCDADTIRIQSSPTCRWDAQCHTSSLSSWLI